jgi:hypothetical protein
MNEQLVAVKRKVEKLTEWVNFNYIGLAAGILSVIVTVYNINKYWADIRKAQRGQ